MTLKTIMEGTTEVSVPVPPRDAAMQAAALRAYLRRAVRFLRDPDGAEQVTPPAQLLATIARQGYAQGDCDDVATLAAAMGLSIGLVARFVVLGFGGPRGPYEHVYAELAAPPAPGRNPVWLDMDTTRPHVAPVQPSRAAVFPV